MAQWINLNWNNSFCKLDAITFIWSHIPVLRWVGGWVGGWMGEWAGRQTSS